MDENQLKELLATTLSEFKAEIMEQVNSANQGLAKNILSRVESKVEAPKEVKPSEDELLSKSLQAQLDDLKSQLAEKDARAIKAEKDAVIADYIAQSDATGKSVLTRQINSLYSDKLVKENDKWYVKDGDNVKEFGETFNEYLSSDEGALFVKPSNTKGSGSSKGESQVSNVKPSKEDAIVAALRGGFRQNT